MLAALELHPSSSSLGYPFSWDTPLAGRPILLRTIEAIASSPSIDRIAVVLPAEESGFEGKVSSLVREARLPATTRLSIFSERGRDAGERERISRQRRLAPAAWRAGWTIPYAVAERGDPLRLLSVAQRAGVEEMLLLPVAAPFVSPRLLDELIETRATHRDAMLRLSTLPPGASGDIVTTALFRDTVERGTSVDHLIRFLPDRPERDLDTKGPFHWYAGEQSWLRHRLTAESRRGLAIMEALWAWREEHVRDDKADGEAWLREFSRSPDRGSILCGPVPAELQLRVTDRVRSASIFDSPHAGTAPAGEDVDPALVERLVGELAEWQEVRLKVCGGEPFLHAGIEAILRSARSSGVGSIVVETDGLTLDDGVTELLRECADAVIVSIDAARPETYARLHGADRLCEVERNVEKLLDDSAVHGGPGIAVEFREVEENCDESEAFLDRWFPVTPGVILSRFRDRAGQLSRRPLHPYSVSGRLPCIRIEDSLVVHPDGRASICDNDLDVIEPAGDLRSQSVEEVWRGGRLAELRALHGEGRWSEVALCAGCDDWCRRG